MSQSTLSHPTVNTMTIERIPLNTLAIPFGVAGLAETWTATSAVTGWTPLLANLLWILTAIVWLWVIFAHIVRGQRAQGRLIEQLRHPVQGPLAALVPIVAMLLGSRLAEYAPLAGKVVVLASIIVQALFAAWIIAQWLRGNTPPTAAHGGYFLPTVAGGLIAAATAATIGETSLAFYSFGIGIFFWVVIFTLLLARLSLFPPLPDALVPSLAILVAPPAVAGIAWFSITGSHASIVAEVLAGLTVLMVLLQIALLPRYRHLTFSLGFWSFTFPYAAVATFAIHWLQISTPLLAPIFAIILAIAITLLVLIITVRSLRLLKG